ncbi:hypothetical protein BLA29_009496 [Euroglyphus maynei]|uniref:Uncharacterized protein n=1 Tax=Euroglyphus maynei TaxID=6958 RepID=A0A1Y3AXG0_EURMA|nr:hypothetical protein BLA29_009496 [Euroglyphus maynei]
MQYSLYSGIVVIIHVCLSIRWMDELHRHYQMRHIF